MDSEDFDQAGRMPQGFAMRRLISMVLASFMSLHIKNLNKIIRVISFKEASVRFPFISGRFLNQRTNGPGMLT